MDCNDFEKIGGPVAAGLYAEPERSLFYRKALGLRRYYENCSLAPYHGEALYPSGKWEGTGPIVPFYMSGLAVDDSAIARQSPEAAARLRMDFDQYHTSVPPEHAVAGNMFTHSIPHYERILQEGLTSYIPRVKRIADRDMREGLLHLIEGIRAYAERCAAYLAQMDAPPELIQAVRRVPMNPAENNYEAIQCWNFILYLDNCDNLGCVVSGLTPYFHGENVTALLRNLFENLDVNNGYSMALHPEDNEALTLQCLEASKGLRRPMIELFVTENTPDIIWQKAFELIRTNNAQPAFYNPALLTHLQKRFPEISDSDIQKFCGGGCTESMIAGYSNVGSLDAGINLPLILVRTIAQTLPQSRSFDSFYRAYLNDVQAVVDRVTTEISRSQQQRAQFNPLPMRTLLIDDCIDRGIEYNAGGARYRWSVVNFAGMINVIDSMLVIRDFVFEQRKYSASEMVRRLQSNDADFLAECRRHSVCYGRDLDDANQFTHRISTDILATLDGKTPYLGGGFLPASIQFMSQVDAGKSVGATPDGRSAGAPLCDSLGAIFGKDNQGPTALLKSVAALDMPRYLGVPVLSFNIQPDFSDEILRALILGYMHMGGIQMQITCASRDVLLDALAHPALHENLIVRVGGYSEYFNRLSDELKRMIIARTIQQ